VETTKPIIINTQNLTRHFNTTKAVDNLTLTIHEGTIFGFLGPNGAGKTTTIRLLLGILEPTSGTAEVLGLNIQKQANQIRAATGVLLEHDGLYEKLSAEDNLEFYSRAWHMKPQERQARIQELLTHFGLYDRGKEPVGTWSKGMKRKLALARTMLHKPTLLFLDEPTSGLDPIASAALREDLSKLAAKEGVTIFLTTHNLSEAENLCDEIGVIAKGKLAAAGTLDELRKRTKKGTVKVEISGRGFTEKLVAQLKAQPEVADAQVCNGKLVVELQQNTNVAPITSLIINLGGSVEEVHKSNLEETFLDIMEAQ
jgi:ABC-2 type transport system ATP-binding protein